MKPDVTLCPKCGKPCKMEVTGKYGQVYEYLVYRHPDGRRRSPWKRTVRALMSKGQKVKVAMRPGWPG